MRKPVFRRLVFITLLYCAIFIFLASLQFTKRGDFTQRLGDLVISGHYRLPAENEPQLAPNEYLLNGAVHISFGGMDFGMFNGRNGGRNGRFMLFTTEDGLLEVQPERMFVSEDSINFAFPGGVELEFFARYIGDLPEMRVAAVFPDEITGIGLPFRPMRRTRISDGGEGQLIFSSGGVSYYFGNSAIDLEHMILVVGAYGAVYRAIPDGRIFSPGDYILSQAETIEAYNEALQLWRDHNFSLWNRTISGHNNEDVVISLIGEAIVRASYRAAVNAVPQAFLRGSSRTYESSVYLGGLVQASRSLIAEENEKLSRISRQINERSLDFLKERRIFEYLAIRGQNNIFEAASTMVRSIDPNLVTLDIVPGILEGYTDWQALSPNPENPFEDLVEQARFVVSESLLRSSSEGSVFVNHGPQRDIEFNLRLGQALLAYAESVQNEVWAGISRSFILSALSYALEIDESSASPGEAGARLYRILSPANTQPRAVAVSSAPDNIWAFTTALELSSVYQNDILSIAVNFPVGETHYMIIRGVGPFSRIQLYNMDYRTDPQFEIYDSSGWSYITQEQTLIVKMQHRSAEEQLRIIFREPPRPVVVAPPPVIADDENGEETLDP